MLLGQAQRSSEPPARDFAEFRAVSLIHRDLGQALDGVTEGFEQGRHFLRFPIRRSRHVPPIFCPLAIYLGVP